MPPEPVSADDPEEPWWEDEEDWEEEYDYAEVLADCREAAEDHAHAAQAAARTGTTAALAALAALAGQRGRTCTTDPSDTRAGTSWSASAETCSARAADSISCRPG
jgi:hypothetical protein